MMREKYYSLGDVTAVYLISDEGRTSLLLLPAEAGEPARSWELGPGAWDVRSEYNREWRQGSLVHLHLRHHGRSRGNGVTMKFSESMEKLTFTKQWTEKINSLLLVRTQLDAEEGYRVIHTLGYDEAWDGLFSETEFVNTSKQDMVLEMLSSFSLDNLSPYQKENDQTGKLALHRFLGSWALEGRHKEECLEDLGLQKAWASPFYKSERFGTVGSWTTQKYFPTAAVEDKEHGIVWGAALETPSSWQMEVTRDGDTVSFSGGLADAETGAWSKITVPGEHFVSARARLAVVKGDYQDVCRKLLNLQKKAAEAYGEKGMPVTFNEYCSSWGNPTQEKELQYAGILQEKGVTYFVIDAGWSAGSHEQWGNGEWLPDEERFPALLEMNKQIRSMGMVPGIWFEFENTTEGSKAFAPAYDDMHLKRDGAVIRFGRDRSFWDFRNEKTRAFLREHVTEFLKKYEFGYMKVDYNGNIGLGCDGAESPGEGLRQQMQAVRDFFLEIKRELPELIVENCASGAHRMEASMMSVTAMTSFSDAHEAKEIPYIAGNELCLCLPKQNLIWAVLRADDTEERLVYSMAAGFLGRLCLSGDIERLSEEQWQTVEQGISLYKTVSHILEHGTYRVYRSCKCSTRHPRGIQAAAYRLGGEMVVVYHGFYRDEPGAFSVRPEGMSGERQEASGMACPAEREQSIVIPLPAGCVVTAQYGTVDFALQGRELRIKYAGEWSAGVLYLK